MCDFAMRRDASCLRASAGRQTIRVRYFDQNNGAARFRILDERRILDHGSLRSFAHTEDRRHFFFAEDRAGVALRPGDEIRIEGSPDGENRRPWTISKSNEQRTGSGWMWEPAVRARS